MASCYGCAWYEPGTDVRETRFDVETNAAFVFETMKCKTLKSFVPGRKSTRFFPGLFRNDESVMFVLLSGVKGNRSVLDHRDAETSRKERGVKNIITEFVLPDRGNPCG